MIWRYIKYFIFYFQFYSISLYTYDSMIQLVTYLLFQLFKSYMFSTDMCCFHGSIYLWSFGMCFSLFRFVYELSLLAFGYESPFIMRLQLQSYCWQPIQFRIYYINTLSQFNYSSMTFNFSYLSIIIWNLFMLFIYITMGIQRLQRIFFTSFLNSLISIGLSYFWSLIKIVTSIQPFLVS